MEKNRTSTLIEDDLACVWHPFTQAQTAGPSILIDKAKGVYLYSGERKYIDAISSWWVNLHGHADPQIAQAIQTQANLLEHVIFAGFTHAPAVELAKKLLSILPKGMSKVFYSDNGSTSVEIALKMSFQYWYNKNPRTKKRKVICFKNSYHGDTFGAMSAAGKNVFNKPFWNHLFDIAMIDPPTRGHEELSLLQLDQALKKGDAAAFIFEPLVLGSGGMIVYPEEGLNKLMKHCKEKEVLLIADEVMTGFGRTGPLFACQKLKETPDIFCLSKGLTGGFLPLGATVCNDKIYNAFLGENLHQALLHGHSYTANPIACRSALASLELLLNERCENQRNKISNLHKRQADKWRFHPKLKRCEALGTLLALEYQSKTNGYFHPLRDSLYRFFLSKDILLRPIGNVIYLLPPYCIKQQELEYIYEQIDFNLENL